MCGRFTLTHRDARLLSLALGVPEEGVLGWSPRYNVAPTQMHPIVRMVREEREVLQAAWGLVNSWASDAGGAARTINARGETLGERTAFREAWEQGRRCLVPADGFYEWQTLGRGEKRPFWFHRKDGGMLWLAGLYEAWSPRPGQRQWTFTIVTTSANGTVGRLHDRMPVILEERDAEEWIFPGNAPGRAAELIRPAGDDVLGVRPVSLRVNDVARDDASLLEREAEQAALF
ncbi:MAG: SOS response-associated peptidase [Dehalococcoidia bacterium]|nr:SOS response-associated peptidase [Dehalococcoidia bacterium]